MAQISFDRALLLAVHAAKPEDTKASTARSAGIGANNYNRAISNHQASGLIAEDGQTLTAEGLRLAGIDAPAASGTPSVALDMIDRNPLNYRRTFDEDALEGLAASILDKGQLQNIIVRPYHDLTDRFQIVAGERRWRAMQLLASSGRWPHDAPVKCDVRDISDLECAEIMVTENAQRVEVHPLEEAEGIRQLQDLREAALRMNEGAEKPENVCGEIGESLGKSRRWAERRVKMVRGISEACRAAYEAGTFTSFETAEALARHPHDIQDDCLKAISRQHNPLGTTNQVKAFLAQSAAKIGKQPFSVEDYVARGGAVIEPEDGTEDQARRFAHRAWAEEMMAEWIAAECAAISSEECHAYTLEPVIENWANDYQYPKAKKSDKIPKDLQRIHVQRSKTTLEVTVRHPVYCKDDYERRAAAEMRAAAAKDAAEAQGFDVEETAKPLGRSTWAEGAAIRTHIVRKSLAGNPNAAMACAVMALLPNADYRTTMARITNRDATGDARKIDASNFVAASLKFEAIEGIDTETGKICDPVAAMAHLIRDPDKCANLFAAAISDAAYDCRDTASAGAFPEALAMHQAGLIDHGRRFEEYGNEWPARLNKGQKRAVIDAYGLALDTVAIDAMPRAEANAAMLAAWPAATPPLEARFITKDQANALELKLTAGKKI